MENGEVKVSCGGGGGGGRGRTRDRISRSRKLETESGLSCVTCDQWCGNELVSVNAADDDILVDDAGDSP